MADSSATSLPVNEIDPNARNRGWNTITGALWKGEHPLATHINDPQTMQTRVDAEPFKSSSDVHDVAWTTDARDVEEKARDMVVDQGPHDSKSAEMPTDHYIPSTEPMAVEQVQPTARSMTAPGRSNVHFAQTAGESPALIQSNAPNSSFPPDATDRPSQIRNTSFMSKILSLSSSNQPSTPTLFSPATSLPDDEPGASGPLSRTFNRKPRQIRSRSAGGDVNTDADAEDNTAEDETIEVSRRARQRRPRLKATTSESTAHSTTPKDQSTRRRAHFPLTRSATVVEERQGLSEDEGRERLARNNAWLRRNGSWLHRDTDQSNNSGREATDNARPSNRRFFSNLAGAAASDGARRPRHEGRAHDAWQRLRNRMTQIVQKSKEEQLDQAKSAELMAELLAGSPAALILASHFQRDEHDKKRMPVLMAQLKVSIPSSSPAKGDDSGDRHVAFHVELEYGNGLMRMKWTIDRTLRDFANLHVKYKLQNRNQKYNFGRNITDDPRTRLPKFPISAFPILRQARGFVDEFQDEDDGTDGTDDPEGQSNTPGVDRPIRRTQRSSSFRPSRQESGVGELRRTGTSSTSNGNATAQASNIPNPLDLKRENFHIRQRKQLEQYLQQLIRYVIFRAGSNRLCRFLELSALGVRLASEGSYHGKEGSLVLQSGKGIDFRRAWRPGLLIQRHTPMWFLVRHSYLVCVDSPEEMNIYDVFLVDGGFQIQSRRPRLRDQKNVHDFTKAATTQARHPQHHILRIQNHERKMRLVARNERQLQQFEDSLRLVRATTEWASKHRFDSFAPVRRNVFAQWLVDGRDYMWNVSRAISMAQDVIYIHDWWLSPEIYMRRPAAISKKWRLDRLLQQKAQEGVKIFVIVYRNINSAIPIDSEYTKFSLLDLHPNIFVQRSPNQLRQNTFFWAHHEKICVVDHMVAFCGGVDLCFGRWDTPGHSVVDDKPTGFEAMGLPLNADHCQLWPGKDYSNPRVLDFFKLNEPYGEMYDRTKVPRMPWHDIGMQIVGQPARDLSRHFVQRWNYILRQRKPTRPTPFLLPPPDFGPNEVETLGLDGTCEIQILRSACDWSIGTPNRVEHSIMNAYVRLILTSEHFVYIENQFFITSCTVEGTKIRNAIGDALTERAIRAHKERKKWRAIVIIPLVPGFQNTVDAQDGSSIRLIMQCQYRSIDRGESSIFERLRSKGIVPEDYIEFFSLRAWGKIGPTKALVTEQLYIHAKCMVVDDRYAIIGSANINERSMLGERDSEIAAVISDTDMLDSTMNGAPYKVGRFPHTLRLRLMREHLGIDVDDVMDEEREEHYHHEEAFYAEHHKSGHVPSDADRTLERKLMQSKHRQQDDLIARYEEMHSFNHDAAWEQENNPHLLAHKKLTADPRVTGNAEHRADVEGHRFDKMAMNKNHPSARGRDTVVLHHDREVLHNSTDPEGKGTMEVPSTEKIEPTETSSASSESGGSAAVDDIAAAPPEPASVRSDARKLTLVSQLPALPATDDTDIGGPPLLRTLSEASAEAFSPLLADLRRPAVTKDCMKDPLADTFFHDVWQLVAANNTKLFRQVFRCMPDSAITSWDQYKAANAYAERFANSQGVTKSHTKMQQEAHGTTGPPGHGAATLGNTMAKVQQEVLGSSDSPDHDKSSMANTFSKMSHVRDDDDDDDGAESDNNSQRNRMRKGTRNSIGAIGQHDPPKSKNEQDQQEEAVEEKDTSFGQKDRGGTDRMDKVEYGPVFTGASREPISEKVAINHSESGGAEPSHGTQQRRRKRATTKSSSGTIHRPDYLPSKEDAEQLLKLIQGNLIEWPYDWLLNEERGGKWLYSVDQMAPLEIYN